MRVHRAARLRGSAVALALVLVALPAAMPRTSIAADPPDDETLSTIRAHIERELEALGVPGAAVVIVHDDAIVFAEGYGRIGDSGREVTPQTPFDLASVSKLLTAIAVMRQVEVGTLSLDSEVRRYLSWFATDQPALADVTVADLMGHTSGWTTKDGVENLLDSSAGTDAIESNVRRLAGIAPTNSRGTFEYSNANYDTLALLVEVTSGRPFDEYVRDEVFAPLGMDHAHTSRDEALDDGLAHGHVSFFGVPMQYEVPFVPSALGSGFLIASAEDLGHALIMHLQDGRFDGQQVLTPESVAVLQRPISRSSPWAGYAGGLNIYPLWSAGALDVDDASTGYTVPIALEHAGDHASTATSVVALPEEGWGVVVLLNMNDSAVQSTFHQLHSGIATILLGATPDPTTVYEDALSQYWRLVFVAVVVLQLIGAAIALTRIRRWGRDPARRPSGVGAILGHVALPAAADLIVAAGLWFLAVERAGPSVPLLIVYQPDVFVALVIVTLLSVGWGLIRTWLTIRVIRRPSMVTETAA